jgi:hypothetical protein
MPTTVGQVILSDLRTQAKQRADMVNSDFVTTSEWNTYLSSAYKELYDVLVGAYGNDYFAVFGTPQTTDGTNNLYALPVDFYKLLGVDQFIGGRWVNVPPFSVTERNRVSSFAGQPPSSGIQFRVIYIPRPAALVNDGDVVDGVAGWEEYIVVRAAIKALVKEESDPSALAQELILLKTRIESMAEDRDAGNPPQTTDALGAMGLGPGIGFGQYSANNYYGYGVMTWPNLRYRLNGNNLWLVAGAF